MLVVNLVGDNYDFDCMGAEEVGKHAVLIGILKEEQTGFSERLALRCERERHRGLQGFQARILERQICLSWKWTTVRQEQV